MSNEDPAAFRTAGLAVIGIVLVIVGMFAAQALPELVTWGIIGLGVALCVGGGIWGIMNPGEAREPKP